MLGQMPRLIGALLWAALAGACAPEPARPPIVLISIDTLAAAALPAFDPAAAPLPALDRFAAECVRFPNAVSSASWTLPAHASLFSGLYPDRHGATDRRVRLADGVATLASELARAGYRTVGFTGGGFLSARYGLGRGFALYESLARGPHSPGESAHALVESLRRFLRQPRGEEPLFLFLHTYALHDYYTPRSEALQRAGLGPPADGRDYKDCVLGRAPCPPASWDALRALYRAQLELVDQAFGELRLELERAGLWDQAVVILLSDHGEGFDPERGRIHHGGRLHADQLRVPLFVRLPGMRAGRAEQGPVSLVDVMPTLLELLELEGPAGLDGSSFLGAIQDGQGAPGPRAARYAMEHYFDWEAGKRTTSAEVRALPLEMAVIGEAWFIAGPHGEELYALEGDAEQRTNRIEQVPAPERLRSQLEARRRARPETGAAEVDERLGAELDALGYGGE
jgi:arylsulfatase A-like enzyme